MADVYSVSIFCVLSVEMFSRKSMQASFLFWTFSTVFHLRFSHKNSFLNFSDNKFSIDFFNSHFYNSSDIPKHLSCFQVL